MEFPTNYYSTSEKEVKAVLACVARQIADKDSCKNYGEDVKAIVKGHRTYKTFVDGDTRYFNQDAVRKALKTIKQHGWRCWEHTDHEGVLSIWITASPIRPHSWYKEC